MTRHQTSPLRYSILREPSSECQELVSRLSSVLTRGRYSQPDFRSGIQLGTRTQSGIVEDCSPPGGNGEFGSAASPHCGYYDPLFLSHHYDQKKTLSYIVFTSQQFSDIIHQPNHIQFFLSYAVADSKTPSQVLLFMILC